jgi:uncharacterized protein
VVEDCVNAVGVDLNTASVPLLTQVSGLTPGIAENLVQFREHNGPFRNRAQLKQVSRLGEKTFQLCAGFLRIHGGDEPLDASAVHPEAYPLARRIAARAGKEIRALIGDAPTLRALEPAGLADQRFGEPTVRDILAELEKPGRDPRPELRTAELREGVEELTDLVPGMVLEGSVTNVTNFGAFVDVGVHQDGLVHVSRLADRFVKDPHAVVQAGQLVRVKVLDVDPERRRIALSMRLDETPESRRGSGGGDDPSPRPSAGRKRAGGPDRRRPGQRVSPRSSSSAEPAAAGVMADAFATARRGESEPQGNAD